MLLLCIASRIATTIYYIEDPDSLRFALSIVDYSVADLRPHFPGYPVFCFIVKVFHLMTGSYAVAFSIAGGLSLFAIIMATLKLADLRIDSLRGAVLAILLFFNPLLWLMSNRYMPDLMGVACVLGSLALLLHHGGDRKRLVIGFFLAGLLAGIRLSYLPMLLPPLVWMLFIERRQWIWTMGALVAGTLIWLVPLIAITGLDALMEAARMQTAGHFTDFGGTVYNEPDLAGRFAQIFRYVTADGMGSYWMGRHWTTAIVAAGLGLALVMGIMEKQPNASRDRSRLLLIAGIISYVLWIWLFQNVLYQSRHILPLLPLLAIPMAQGFARLIGSWRVAGIAIVAVIVAAYATVTITLALQHREPTAIAQAKEYIASLPGDSLVVASVPLINYYLEMQGIRARYLSVRDARDRETLAHLAPGIPLVTVGSFPDLTGTAPATRRIFFHNPYVNGIWPELTVEKYER